MPTILPLRSVTTALALNVPTQWADVSLAQYVALFAPEPDDTRRKAELLCSLPAGYLDDLAADDVKYLATLLEFSSDPSAVQELLPTPGLPSIGSLPYGILLEAQNHLEANPDRPWLAYAPYLLALYRVQMAYGKYSASKVAACLDAVLAAPVTEVLADAAFFLSSYRQWLSDTPPTRPTTTSPTRPSTMQVAKKWARGLARCWASIWPPTARC